MSKVYPVPARVETGSVEKRPLAMKSAPRAHGTLRRDAGARTGGPRSGRLASCLTLAGAALAGAALLWAHVPAGAQLRAVPEDVSSVQVAALSRSELTNLLQSVDLAGEPLETQGGDPLVSVRTPPGGRFFIALRACPALLAPSCPHMEFFAPFAGDSPNAEVEALNLFNRQAVGVKAFRLPGGTVVLARYVTLNHGIAQGNILGNVVGFQRSAERFRTFLAGPPLVPEERGPQIAVTNGADPPESAGDPAYAPAQIPWASIVNEPQTSPFTPDAQP
ncbi:MAG: YbjN domain-containing protein [Alphaproteobacteria bacterium]